MRTRTIFRRWVWGLVLLIIGVTAASGAALAAGGPTVVPVTAGGYHTLAILEDGTVQAWGWNSNGQLGDGSLTNHSTPAPVNGLSGVAAVSAGVQHSLALKNDGTVWSWGRNDVGQLGDGTLVQRKAPVAVSGLTGVTAVSSGDYHNLALKSDGTVWSWGSNYFGQLGDGTITNRNTPVPVSSLTGIIAVAAGGDHSLALKNDGTLWAWGNNSAGELGDGTTVQRRSPVAVSGIANVTAMTAGGVHNLALKQDGTVWSWGSNWSGQLGDGSFEQRNTPVPVSGLSGIAAVAAGSSHSLALKGDGTVWTWGLGNAGQMGDGSFSSRKLPAPIAGMTNMVALDAGVGHSLALRNDGSVWSCGYNAYGQIGDGTDNNWKTAATQAMDLGRVKQPEGGAAAPYAAVSADQSSVTCGQTVTLTAVAGGFSSPVYDFWIREPREGTWSSLRPYGSSPVVSFTRTVPGTYTILVYAKGAADPFASAVQSQPLTVTFSGQGVSALTVSGPNGAQPVGGSATFAASATDESGTPLYQFWTHDTGGWHQVGAYSANNQLSLSNLQSGSYVIAAYALDQADIAAGNWGKAFYQVFILNVGSTVTLEDIFYDLPISQPVQITAAATGLTGAEYQFWYRTPSGQWQQSGDYTASGNYSFQPTEVGWHRVIVYAKDHYAPATDQFSVADESEIYVTDEFVL